MLGPRSGHCAPDTLTHTCAHACTPMCGCVHGTHVGTHNLSTHTHGQRPPGPHMHSGAHTYLPPTHMHTHTPICMYTHARTHTCTHTHVHITCIHTHHTNTHTHMLTLTLEHTGIRGLSGHSRCGRRSLLHSPPLPPKAAPKAEHPSPTSLPTFWGHPPQWCSALPYRSCPSLPTWKPLQPHPHLSSNGLAALLPTASELWLHPLTQCKPQTVRAGPGGPHMCTNLWSVNK